MAKPGTIFKALSRLVGHPRESLSLILDSDSVDQKSAREYVSRTYGSDRGFPQIDLLDLFPGLSVTVAPYTYLSDTSLAVDIALLKSLAGRYDSCRYLEIGTLRGESIANVASVAAECVSVSLSEDEMRTRGFEKNFIAMRNFFSHDLPNVTHIGHDSHTFDFGTLGKNFDLIFVDGDHTRDGIRKDTEKVFPLLKDDRSVIVWHDYGFTTERIRWTTVAGILDGCPPEYRGDLYHVSHTKCALFMRGKPDSAFYDFPRYPDTVFEVTLRGRKL